MDYERPPLNLAAACGLAAFLLKFDRWVGHGTELTAHAWVPLLLAPLALGMVRAYPGRGCVHASLALFCWGGASVIAPSLAAPGFLTLSLVVLALGLQGIDLAARPIEQDLWSRLELHGAQFRSVVRRWWQALGVLGIISVSSLLVFDITEALSGVRILPLEFSQADWWAVAAAIVLVGTQVLLLGRDPALLGVLGPEGLLIGIELAAVALLWWLGVGDSPLAHRGMRAGDYYPLITAMVALAIADVNGRLDLRRNWDESAAASGQRNSQLARLSSPALLVLTILAACFTCDRENVTTVATLGLAALALGFWAVRQEALWAAYLGSLAWSGTGLMGGLVLARRMSFTTLEPRLIFAALLELAAVATLGVIGGLLRNRAVDGGRRKADSPGGLLARSRPLAIATEQLGLIGSLVVAGLVGVAATQPGITTGWLAAAEIGALLAVALFHLLLARRWARNGWFIWRRQACWGRTSCTASPIPCLTPPTPRCSRSSRLLTWALPR